MDDEDARRILLQELAHFRGEPYGELAMRIGQIQTKEIDAPSGVTYQIEIQIIWDDKTTGDARVMGCIDDGGLRAFFPLTDSFIMNAQGGFVDE